MQGKGAAIADSAACRGQHLESLRVTQIHPDPDGWQRRRMGLARTAAASRPPRRWSWWRALFVAVALTLLLSMALCVSLRWFNPPTTAFMLAARAVAVMADDREFTIDQRWLPLAAQSRWAALAVIAAEDQKFMRHGGFDFDAMQSAIDAHQRGASLRGASTLSQQLAKNLFLWSGRSWLRKGLEAWLTVLLETTLPKSRILELYLNVVEFGPGVYGVEAASQRYFGHGAATLDAEEAAALAAVLPAPSRYSVVAPSPHVRDRQQWILRQMRTLGDNAAPP